MTNVSIIIPNFNGEKFLPDCLNSLLTAIKNCPSIKFEIILVDNASSDNSIKIFNQYFLNSKILFLDKNYGFAQAVNQGIDASTSDWILVCNNDLKTSPYWLSIITKAINNNSDPKLAAITGTILNYSGTDIESQGLKYYPYGKCTNLNNHKKVTPKFLRQIKTLPSKYIWGASAALTLYNRKILKKSGKFDNDFFAYEEDVDLAIRLQHLRYRTLYVPGAVCYHLGGGTSNKMGNFRSMMDAKNWIYIIIKNYSKKEIFLNLFPIIIERLRNLSGLIKHTPKTKMIPTIVKTYQPVFKNFRLMIQKRKQINSLYSLLQDKT